MEIPKKKHAVLLSMCGPTTFHLMKNLLSPSHFTEHSFAELFVLVEKKYNVKLNVTASALISTSVFKDKEYCWTVCCRAKEAL